MDLGKSNLSSTAPKSHQQESESGFHDYSTTTLGPQSVVPASFVTSPSVVLCFGLTNKLVVFTSSTIVGQTYFRGIELEDLETISRALCVLNYASTMESFLLFFSCLHCLLLDFSFFVRSVVLLDQCLLHWARVVSDPYIHLHLIKHQAQNVLPMPAIQTLYLQQA